ncbi:WecB/TagA/CpsF family glycosyltransferase [Bradyrhizobium sp. B117]|uniref:WecB/TagA/CpsF family glycosyltransferase n=1 Tax=Bradyrhizobium sp. B117 TaxID=3140246 RepID=UPI00318356DC
MSDANSPAGQIGQTRILGVPISLTDLSRASRQISGWARAKTRSYAVFVRDTPSVALVAGEPHLLALHEKASLVVADGLPLVWTCRIYGRAKDINRVPGADLVDEMCKLSLVTGQSHYFYGGRPQVAQRMAEKLSERYPGLKIAGICCPPMLNVDANFRFEGPSLRDLEAIRDSGADFVWVGISTPKQEYWIGKATELVPQGVFLGVGAAFDFHAGSIPRAPNWMKNNGLEWFYRLCKEPRRLWRRYLVLAPIFVIKSTAEFTRRSFERGL